MCCEVMCFDVMFDASIVNDDDSDSTEVYKSEIMMDGYLDDIEMQVCS